MKHAVETAALLFLIRKSKDPRVKERLHAGMIEAHDLEFRVQGQGLDFEPDAPLHTQKLVRGLLPNLHCCVPHLHMGSLPSASGRKVPLGKSPSHRRFREFGSKDPETRAIQLMTDGGTKTGIGE